MNDTRIVVFELDQLDGYSDVTKSLFIHCMLEQLRLANRCNIRLDWDLQLKINELYKSLDDYMPCDLSSMYLKRMMIDWFSNSVNCSFIDGWQSMLDVFEIFKETMDSKRINPKEVK